MAQQLEVNEGTELLAWMHCSHSVGQSLLLVHKSHPSVCRGWVQRMLVGPLLTILCPAFSSSCQPCYMSLLNIDGSVCLNGCRSNSPRHMTLPIGCSHPTHCPNVWSLLDSCAEGALSVWIEGKSLAYTKADSPLLSGRSGLGASPASGLYC